MEINVAVDTYAIWLNFEVCLNTKPTTVKGVFFYRQTNFQNEILILESATGRYTSGAYRLPPKGLTYITAILCFFTCIRLFSKLADSVSYCLFIRDFCMLLTLHT